LQPDNRIVAGGNFTRASGVSRGRITRLMPDGTVDPTINFGSGANNFVAAVAIQPDGKLVIGGGFTQVQGTPAGHIARLYGGSVVGSGSLKFEVGNYQVNENATNVSVNVIRTGGAVRSRMAPAILRWILPRVMARRSRGSIIRTSP
jgi:hypothetical protein